MATKFETQELIAKNTRECDYHKGTCAICYGTVRRGMPIVTIMLDTLGEVFRRNVHDNCAHNLSESSPKDSQPEVVALQEHV